MSSASPPVDCCRNWSQSGQPAPACEATAVILVMRSSGAASFTSPVLGQAVMLGWLKRSPFPERVEVDGRSASVVQPPFYDPEGTRARA